MTGSATLETDADGVDSGAAAVPYCTGLRTRGGGRGREVAGATGGRSQGCNGRGYRRRAGADAGVVTGADAGVGQRRADAEAGGDPGAAGAPEVDVLVDTDDSVLSDLDPFDLECLRATTVALNPLHTRAKNHVFDADLISVEPTCLEFLQFAPSSPCQEAGRRQIWWAEWTTAPADGSPYHVISSPLALAPSSRAQRFDATSSSTTMAML